MYIKEVVLDGFKSYAARTIISGWDPKFNAITGLNGSGKSNILDAICFVLGITSLNNVRALNMVDLIYKRGKAGITKASVSIVFDNTDKERSPVGYTEVNEIVVTRQVALTGATKYYVNGYSTTLSAVHTLFQCVQLNVNNPHFLIMQGKITKVLNMRPKDILAMLEEAAGTRMFLERKITAENKIEKKNQELERIESTLREDVFPRMERLRLDRTALEEYQIKTSEVETLEHEVVSREHQYFQSLSQNADAARNTIISKIVAHEDNMNAKKALLDSLDTREQDITKRAESDEAKLCAKKIQSLNTLCAQSDVELSESRRSANTLREKVASISARANSTDDARVLANQRLSKEREYERQTSLISELRRELERLEAQLTSLKMTAMSKDQDSSAKNAAETARSNLLSALTVEKSMYQKYEAEANALRSRLEYAQRELESWVSNASAQQETSKNLENEYNQLKAKVQGLEQRLAKLRGEYDESRHSQARLNQANLEAERNRIAREANSLKAQVSHYTEFIYEDPEPGFDRSKVIGTVASLLHVPEQHYDKCLALEVTSGPRLQNVVVANRNVATALLSKGRLQRRTTFLPLDKIQPYHVKNSQKEAVAQVGMGKVKVAKDILNYPQNIETAIDFVFGSTLIAPDQKLASKVAFHNSIKMRTVTWEGDVYEPSGTLVGGGKPATSGVLQKLSRARDLEQHLANLDHQITALTQECAKYETEQRNIVSVETELNSSLEYLEKLKEKLKEQSLARSEDKRLEYELLVSEISGKLTNLEEQATSVREKIARFEKELKEIEAAARNGSTVNVVQNSIKDVEAKITVQKSQVAKASKVLDVAKEGMQKALDEEQFAAESRENAKRELFEMQAQLEEEERQVDAAVAASQQRKAELEMLTARLRQEREKNAQCERELQDLRAQKRKINNEIEELSDAKRKLERDLERADRETDTAAARVQRLESGHPWLLSAQYAEKRNSEGIDQRALNPQETSILRAKYEKLKVECQKMKQGISLDVAEKLQVAEALEGELRRKIMQVERDKAKLQETIRKLDAVTVQALKTTWIKVNQDFGAIFNDLLPGNTAKLEPVRNNILQGLDIHVCLGTIWRESLSELSGGQRSLVALSLILALLQFKPAPVYILDEVDAALDLSHTQNIGQLVRTRFTNSQFIIVSLKEGMFSNANVLFRAKFNNGTSVVERTARQKK